MVAGDFLFSLFFGSFVTLLLNIVFLAVCLFLAGRILNIKRNSAKNAVQVALIALLIGLLIILFPFIGTIFLLAIEFFAMLFAVKIIYKTDYYNALVLLVLATVVFAVIVWLFSSGGFTLR